MARLRLTLHDISCYENSALVAKNLIVATEQGTDTAYFQKSSTENYQYTLTLVDFGFKKQMYQPTEIIAEIQLSMTAGTTATWQSLSRSVLDKLFKHKKVTLDEIPVTGSVKDAVASHTIGDDFFVHEVIVHHKPQAMYVTLKIYSLDKLLTLEHTSRTFVSKKLGENIIKTEIPTYIKPWTAQEKLPPLKKEIEDKKAKIVVLTAKITTDPSNSAKYTKEINQLQKEVDDQTKEKEELEKKQSPMEYSFDDMKHLIYQKEKGGTTEHIFPFLMQYNESFHDMLARTANRWGEFLYYENGKLNFGYNAKQNAVEPKGWHQLNYCDLNSKLSLSDKGDHFNLEAAYDKNVLNSPVPKSPNIVKNVLGCSIDDGLDVWLMKKVSSFLNNTKSIPTWLGNQAFDELYAQAEARYTKKALDKESDDVWFAVEDDKKDEHYGSSDDKEKVNPFSEFESKFDNTKYSEILVNEKKAGVNALLIDFDTTNPHLKLGNIITIAGEQFIVVEISSKTEVKDSYSITEDEIKKASADKTRAAVTKTTTTALKFQVVATPQNSTDEKFYPTMLPTGHVRYSGPQQAVVTDNNDPLWQNRVRVMFSWQNAKSEKKTNGVEYDKDTIDASSPWLVHASSSAGNKNGVYGKHHPGDFVLVDFANGNVERPFVVGSLPMEDNKVPPTHRWQELTLTSPGQHALKLNDGSGAGLTAFLAGFLLPCYDMMTTFFPDTWGKDIFEDSLKTSNCFEGGFELSDKYGVYKISGSTDGRNVSVKSPWGDVEIGAFTGINISAPNGDISIKGKNVSIEAGNNLELISGTNVKRKLAQKETTAGQSVLQFGGDMMTAVLKKLAERAQVMDLSAIRAAVEVVFWPVEGALTVKSNRFLKLESGKGECEYPVTAYKDQATFDKLKAKQEKKELRPGLKLNAGINELVCSTGKVADSIRTQYMNLYNNCVDKMTILTRTIAEGNKWVNGADPHAAYCNTGDALIAKLWKDGKDLLTEADLGFQNYDINSEDDVDGGVLNRLKPAGQPLTNAVQDALIARIIPKRKLYRANILKAANQVRKNIIKLNAYSDAQLSNSKILSAAGSFKNKLPDNWREALVAAFNKKNLGDDIFFYKKVEGDKKALTDKYEDANNAIALATERKVLSRKAAVILLEELGFKDEWRTEDVITRDTIMQAANIALDAQWGNYVDSIHNVPPLSHTEYITLMGTLKTVGNVLVDLNNIMEFVDIQKENRSWSEAKNGAILFSDGNDTYQLSDNIAPVDGPSKDRLDIADDDVHTFLTDANNGLRAKLKGLI